MVQSLLALTLAGLTLTAYAASSNQKAAPDCVDKCWTNTQYVSQCNGDHQCLCDDSEFQNAVYQCLYSQCSTSKFGTALHHALQLCQASQPQHEEQPSPVTPVEYAAMEAPAPVEAPTEAPVEQVAQPESSSESTEQTPTAESVKEEVVPTKTFEENIATEAIPVMFRQEELKKRQASASRYSASASARASASGSGRATRSGKPASGSPRASRSSAAYSASARPTRSVNSSGYQSVSVRPTRSSARGSVSASAYMTYATSRARPTGYSGRASASGSGKPSGSPSQYSRVNPTGYSGRGSASRTGSVGPSSYSRVRPTKVSGSVKPTYYSARASASGYASSIASRAVPSARGRASGSPASGSPAAYTTTMTMAMVSQVTDGQVQAPTAPTVVTQVIDGQVQAPSKREAWFTQRVEARDI